jgi:hypothetical protein
MGKVKRLELWLQLYLYVTSGSGLRKKPTITLCAFECTLVSCKVPFIFIRSLWNSNFIDIFFRKILKYQIFFKKSFQWQTSCSMWTVRLRERDVTNLTVAFRNFANAPKNLHSLVIGNNIATGLSDYLPLFMKQRQSSLHKKSVINSTTIKWWYK